jgi:plasmid stabilization system protein ParE
VAGSIELQWSDDALADLNRFGAVLHEQSPELAATVADAIVARTQILTRHPKLGRPLAGREEYRQLGTHGGSARDVESAFNPTLA